MGYDFDQLFPNRFMKAGEFKGLDLTLTIAEVQIEELDGSKGKQTKGIITFRETTKALVLNKTNGLCIRAMFGRDTGNWLGKRVTLWPAPIQYEDSDLAIRVRGSPDLEADLEFELKLARKKPKNVRLLKTTPRRAEPPPPPEPGSNG